MKIHAIRSKSTWPFIGDKLSRDEFYTPLTQDASLTCKQCEIHEPVLNKTRTS